MVPIFRFKDALVERRSIFSVFGRYLCVAYVKKHQQQFEGYRPFVYKNLRLVVTSQEA